MPAAAAREVLAVLDTHGVEVCVGGGWSVDALLGEQTRPHSDLDVWVSAADTSALFASAAELGIDRVYPWPGDRPWNFVLHDGGSRRVDLHFYELEGSRLHYGSLSAPFSFTTADLSGRGLIDGRPVRCERPEFALACHTGYPPRDVDRHDIALLCERFGLPQPGN